MCTLICLLPIFISLKAGGTLPANFTWTAAMGPLWLLLAGWLLVPCGVGGAWKKAFVREWFYVITVVRFISTQPVVATSEFSPL
jgi:hypothetical protein